MIKKKSFLEDSMINKVQKTFSSLPYLLCTLKRADFREEILVNVYRSYALSHITYSSPVLSSPTTSVKEEMESFQRRCLRIININHEALLTRYKLTTIESLIDKICVQKQVKILNEPEHHVTSKLTMAIRFGPNFKFNTAKAHTNAYANSFLQKYIRLLRDGTVAAYLPSRTTGIKWIRDTKTTMNVTQPTMKPAKEQVKCPKCDKFSAPGAGLASHQRHKHPNIYWL